jgi:hypothetical protein
MSMFPLLAVLGTGLALCAADAVMAARHQAGLSQPADCRVITDVRVLSRADAAELLRDSRHHVIVIIDDNVVDGMTDVAHRSSCRKAKLKVS